MTLTPLLESERLLFKPLSLAHLSEEYVSWLNDKEVNKYLESGGDYTLEKLKCYLEAVEKKEILFWAIHIKESDKHIGNIKIDPIIKKHGVGEYGILMGDKNEWGKGYAKEASLKIIDYCFNTINIRKITLGVVEEHNQAVQLYFKLGFSVEGKYIKQGLYNGHYCDTLRMALFNPNFRY
ncbi:MAG TPA: GNAT family protein [Chitinophagaceae bacterium]|nr:GNAT family protein [Chitinophagaceae bacterium]